MNREQSRTLVAVGSILLLAAAGIAFLFFVPRGTARAWTAEPGPLEYVTVVLYVLGAVLLWLLGPRYAKKAGSAVLLLLALIKLDPGGWVLAKKADSLVFYTSPEIPAVKKVIAAVLFLLVAALAGIVIAGTARRFRQGLREGRAPAVLVALALVLFATSLVLDRIQGFMTWPHLGYHTHPELYFGVGAAEEVLEILVPGSLLLALGISRMQSGTPRADRAASPVP